MDSRLDRMIARLTTQRRALERAAEEIGGLPGPVLEIGLGKGRTYSHLRKLFPERTIIAFDRDLHAPADAAPAGDDLVLGDFRDTLSALPGRTPVECRRLWPMPISAARTAPATPPRLAGWPG